MRLAPAASPCSAKTSIPSTRPTTDPSVLETFGEQAPGNDYFVKFNCP
ncbi:MAG: hypothetical protein ACLTDR_15385 [Adlercreutzia equolifaciens]